jgi:hypothetical protein
MMSVVGSSHPSWVVGMVMMMLLALVMVPYCFASVGDTVLERVPTVMAAGNVTNDKEMLFVLSQGLRATTCTKNQCRPGLKSAQLLIHGLWLDYVDGTYPHDCGAEFSMEPIRPLLDRLNYYWPSLYNDPEFLWKHEYTKHGSCMTKWFPNQYDYFSKTLELRMRTDVYGSFLKYGLVPGQSYEIDEYQKAVQRDYGTRPLIQCYLSGSEKQPMVWEVWMMLPTTSDLSRFGTFPPQFLDYWVPRMGCHGKVLLPIDPSREE